MKIKDLNEIVDSDGELIGSDNIPQVSSNADSEANNTTDYNLQIGHQPYRYDTLARFGFLGMPFYEGVDKNEKVNKFINESYETINEFYKSLMNEYYRKPDKLKSEFRKYKDSKFSELTENRKENIFETVSKMYELFDSIVDRNLNENEIVVLKNNGIMSEKKDNEILSVKLQKVADLINRLDYEEKQKLIKLIEDKNE